MGKINAKQEMVILRGLQGSGKSTYAHNWVAEDPDWRFRVNRDDIRQASYNKLWGLSHQQEGVVSNAEVALATMALDNALSVVIDATNLRARVVREWYALADKYDIPVRVVDIDVPLEECIARDLDRGFKRVGEDVIRSYYDRYFTKGKFPPVPPHLKDEPIGRAYDGTPGAPKAVWIDVDGTLAHRDHPEAPQPVRGPFDEARVGEDAVIEHIVDLTRLLSQDYKIVIMSGRSDACMAETEKWLIDNNIPYDDIFMRKSGDMRKDNIVKHDLFWDNVAPKYDVKFALDDRQQVVDFTRNVLKIPVLQVAEGNF